MILFAYKLHFSSENMYNSRRYLKKRKKKKQTTNKNPTPNILAIFQSYVYLAVIHLPGKTQVSLDNMVGTWEQKPVSHELILYFQFVNKYSTVL